MEESTDVLLEARYTQVEGTDSEYAQGAIERNELAHHEIEPLVWLILVETPGDPAVWKQRLNEAVEPRYGSFDVRCAPAEKEQEVRSGRIKLQK